MFHNLIFTVVACAGEAATSRVIYFFSLHPRCFCQLCRQDSVSRHRKDRDVLLEQKDTYEIDTRHHRASRRTGGWSTGPEDSEGQSCGSRKGAFTD